MCKLYLLVVIYERTSGQRKHSVSDVGSSFAASFQEPGILPGSASPYLRVDGYEGHSSVEVHEAVGRMLFLRPPALFTSSSDEPVRLVPPNE